MPGPLVGLIGCPLPELPQYTGQHVVVSRVYTPGNRVGVFQTATMAARFDGNSITGSGPEHNSGGRTCDIALTRAQ